MKTEYEEKYRELFENANDAIYTHSLDGYMLTINNAGAKLMLGCESKEDVIGTHISRWLTPEGFEYASDIIKKHINGEPVKQPIILEIITKNGEHKWYEFRNRLVIDGSHIKAIHGIGRDITEKIYLERDLKESEARYRELFDKANDPMYIHDASGFILNVNEAGVAGLKCTKEEFIGSHISRWLTQESFLEFKERLAKRIVGEPVEQPAVIEVICKDGEHRWAEIRTRVVYEKGRVKEIHGIARDITEKRRLEEKLRESEAKFRDLFENAQDAMYVLDTEGIVLKMNRVGLAILGCTKEEVIGKNISNWLTAESNKIVEERRKKIRSGERVNQIEVLEIVSKKGEHRFIEIKTRRIKDEGRTIEVHGIGRDITENKILKQELSKSNKQRNLLCYLIKGTRGGKARALILKHLSDRSYNAHQLAKALNMDYKTIRHHINVLIKNGIINVEKNGNNSAIYFISNNVSANLNDIDSNF